VFSESASAEFSFFYTKRSSSDLYIQTYRELRGSDSWQLSNICRLLTEGSSKFIFHGVLVRHAKLPFATTLDQWRQRTCDLESRLDALLQIKLLHLFS
jgi:hypothetical protein